MRSVIITSFEQGVFTITLMNIFHDYLFSIAYMETAISKLLEAQAKKISIFAEGKFTITQMANINGSIKNQMKILENLHLLLLNKFEQIINSLEIQDIHEEIEPKSEFKFEMLNHKQKEEFLKQENIDKLTTYLFKGRGQGIVSNLKDPYCSGLAIFQTHVSDANHGGKELFLSYSVMKGTKMLVLLSSPEKMKTRFILDSAYQSIKAEGTGIIIIKERSKADIREAGKYLFNVQTDNSGAGSCLRTAFEMEIQTEKNKLFIHESGLINSQASRIVIEPARK